MVCAVIVTYADRGSMCMEAAKRAYECGAEAVVIVDNGSASGSRDLLESECGKSSDFFLVRMDRNRGSASGFGCGAQNAMSLGPEYVWFLDDDNIADLSALRILISAAGVHGERCVAAPRRRMKDDCEPSTEEAPSLQAPVGSFLGSDFLARIQKMAGIGKGRRDVRRVVPYAPYGGLLVPHEIIERVGYPNPDFILYGDDVDWTLRISRMGGTIVRDGDAVIWDMDGKWQREGLSGGPRRLVLNSSHVKMMYTVRNSTYIDKERIDGVGAGVRFAANIVLYSLWVLAYCVLLRRPWVAIQYLKCLVRGLSGRLGKIPGAPLEELDASLSDPQT